MITIENTQEKGKVSTYIVKLHNGLQLQMEMAKTACCWNLVEKACEYLECKHPYYFGLEYSYRKLKYTGWLDGKKSLKAEIDKLHKVAYLSFKFYDPEPETIPCEALRHALYVQLRRDVVNGNLINDMNILAKLSALCLQIEIGGYKDEIEFRRNASFYTFGPDYLNLSLEMGSEFYNKVFELYRDYQGYEIVQAEIEFIKTCSSLPFYGLHRFLLTDSNKTTCEIGIGYYGLYIIDDDDTVSNIILWGALKSIILKDIDIHIQIADEDTLTKNIPNNPNFHKYGLDKKKLFKIYEICSNENIIYKGCHHNYAKSFYKLVVESLNFYYFKKPTASKNSSETLIEKTLTEIRDEYGYTSNSLSTSKIKYTKFNTTKNIKCAKGDTLKHKKTDISPENDEIRRKPTILKSDMLDTDDRNSTSSKLKEMLSLPKNIVKKKKYHKSKNKTEPEQSGRTRSATISTGLLRATCDYMDGMSSVSNKRNSLLNNESSMNAAEQFGTIKSSFTDNFNVKAISQLDLKKGNVSTHGGDGNDKDSSESSATHLVIESIKNTSKRSHLNSHLSVFNGDNTSENSGVSHHTGINIEKSDNQNSEDMFEKFNVWSKKESFSSILSNTDDILEFINNEQTVENGKLLAKTTTNIKNNGPSTNYDFQNNSNNDQMAENWIHSIGTKSDTTNTNNCMDSLINDFDKKFEIHDTGTNNSNPQINPLLQSTTTPNNDPSLNTILDLYIGLHILSI